MILIEGLKRIEDHHQSRNTIDIDMFEKKKKNHDENRNNLEQEKNQKNSWRNNFL
jgi:hypothetical protein